MKQTTLVHHGFTLLELLVVITIMGVLLTGSIAGYGRFNTENRLKQAALTLKNNLRFAQTLASSGKKPEDTGAETCGKLLGYVVTFPAPPANKPTTYTIGPLCDSGALFAAETKTFSLPVDITIVSSPASLTFYVLTRGTDSVGSTPIVLQGTGNTYTLTITGSGDIIDKGMTHE
jgi:prepilin-type N-terminal cleavage/methylation domain-containing protein